MARFYRSTALSDRKSAQRTLICHISNILSSQDPLRYHFFVEQLHLLLVRSRVVIRGQVKLVVIGEVAHFVDHFASAVLGRRRVVYLGHGEVAHSSIEVVAELCGCVPLQDLP